jgi:hypothetical protein
MAAATSRVEQADGGLGHDCPIRRERKYGARGWKGDIADAIDVRGGCRDSSSRSPRRRAGWLLFGWKAELAPTAAEPVCLLVDSEHRAHNQRSANRL